MGRIQYAQELGAPSSQLEEAQDVFFNEPLIVRSDIRHSRREKRYYALGQTSTGRCLFVAFTIRKTLVRVSPFGT
jgi:uncharacterized DUF497 family protein